MESALPTYTALPAPHWPPREVHALLRNHAAAHPRQAHAVESLAMLHTNRNDGKEGVASFNYKRAPAFTGRASSDLPDFYSWW